MFSAPCDTAYYRLVNLLKVLQVLMIQDLHAGSFIKPNNRYEATAFINKCHAASHSS